MNVARFEGGRWSKLALVFAVLGLGLTLVFGFFNAERAFQAYHVAFVYWAGIAVAALIMNMAFQAANAKWYVVIRRILESIPLALQLFFLLFIPILLGARHLFPWVNPAGLDEELRKLAAHREAYLNLRAFGVRWIVYFAIWLICGQLLYGWSVRQDTEGGAKLTLKARKLGAGALPFVALAMTFAAFDWEMSLDLHLASTIFGVYYFAGSFLAAFAVVILAVNAMRKDGLPGAFTNPNHYHSLGKYLLAFVCFWGYIGFSQFLLMWIANLPEETPWYLDRASGPWLGVGIFIVLFHFVVPFFILLSRDLKRNPRSLSFMAVWILVVHFVDIYWVMMPAMRGAHGFAPHLADVTAFFGVGGAALAFVSWRVRGRAAVPIGDPYLADSLRYDPS